MPRQTVVRRAERVGQPNHGEPWRVARGPFAQQVGDGLARDLGEPPVGHRRGGHRMVVDPPVGHQGVRGAAGGKLATKTMAARRMRFTLGDSFLR
jgi:hypothetical protein